MIRLAGRLMLVGLFAGAPLQTANAANIDEIAYLSNKALKELSAKAMAMLAAPSLGVCGRRRELPARAEYDRCFHPQGSVGDHLSDLPHLGAQ